MALKTVKGSISLTAYDPCEYLCSLRLDLLSLQIFLDGCDPPGVCKFKLDYIACTLHLHSKRDIYNPTQSPENSKKTKTKNKQENFA